MPDRLPDPCLQVGFHEDAALPECLRSAHRTATRLGVGVLFEREEQEYVVWPWMSVDQALELFDASLAESVREHLHG